MDFDESVRAIKSLSDEAVEAEVWGVVDGAPVVFLSGELSHMSHIANEELAPVLTEALGEAAETFVIGDAQLDLWRSRFIDGDPMPNTRGWLELHTKDVVLRIGPKLRPWAD